MCGSIKLIDRKESAFYFISARRTDVVLKPGERDFLEQTSKKLQPNEMYFINCIQVDSTGFKLNLTYW